MLDDVAAHEALAVARRDERAPQERDRDLAAVRVAGDRERDPSSGSYTPSSQMITLGPS